MCDECGRGLFSVLFAIVASVRTSTRACSLRVAPPQEFVPRRWPWELVDGSGDLLRHVASCQSESESR